MQFLLAISLLCFLVPKLLVLTSSKYESPLGPFEKQEQSWLMALCPLLEMLLCVGAAVNDSGRQLKHGLQPFVLPTSVAICCPCDFFLS